MRRSFFIVVVWVCFYGSANAQPDEEVLPCRAVPPVEDVRLQNAPPALIDALKRDIGRYVGPGEPFDRFDEVIVGVNKQILWIRQRENRWVVAYWHGGRFIQIPILVYELPLSGPAVLLRSAGGFPQSACQMTERELFR
jgi:hypothetical protein